MGTTTKGFPYPEGTDPVMQGDDAIKALAEVADDKSAYGQGAVASSSVANIAPDTVKTKAVTFPAGRFTQPPAVGTSLISTYTQTDKLTISGLTMTSMTLRVYNGSASSTRNMSVSYIMMQHVAGTAAELTHDTGGPQPATGTVTCPTPGCENQNVPIAVPLEEIDEDGNPLPIDSYGCGICNTDLEVTTP